MLSVIEPVNLRFAGAAASAATISTLKNSRFMPGFYADLAELLFTRSHQMSRRGTGIHDPHSAGGTGFRKAERLGGGHRDSDGHVRRSVFLIRAAQVIPDRSELGLH